MDAEDIEMSNLWIPIKSLRKAAEIQTYMKPGSHRKTVSSPPETPSNALTPKKFSKLNSTPPFSINLHTRYNTASVDSFQPFMHNESDFPQAERKYSYIICKLNEEIMILSTQLKQSNQLVFSLSKKLNELNKKHALHIQALQERHESKLKRLKFDLDTFVKEVSSQNTLSFKEELQKELISERKKFDLEIKEKCREYQEEIDLNNYENFKQIEAIKGHCIRIVTELKDEFFKEIESLEDGYKKKINRIKNKYRLEELSVDDDNEARRHKEWERSEEPWAADAESIRID